MIKEKKKHKIVKKHSKKITALKNKFYLVKTLYIFII
jgi:hypothetical protein